MPEPMLGCVLLMIATASSPTFGKPHVQAHTIREGCSIHECVIFVVHQIYHKMTKKMSYPKML